MGIISGKLFFCSHSEGSSDITTNSRKQTANDRLRFCSGSDEIDSASSNFLPRFSSIRMVSTRVSMELCSADPGKRAFSRSKAHPLVTHKQSMDVYDSIDKSPTSSYGVILCKSFVQYLQNRDYWVNNLEYDSVCKVQAGGHYLSPRVCSEEKQLVSPYEIHLEEYNKRWEDDAKYVMMLLESIKDKRHWNSIEHIGSTSIPGMLAKPVIDIMITLNPTIEFKKAIENFLRDQAVIKDLPVKIGFIDKAPFSNDDWGFFQIPRPAAKKHNMREVNIHVFVKHTQSAKNKLLFRDFLSSEVGAGLRKEYCDLKRQLMLELEGKEGLTEAHYSFRKDDIVAKIINEATKWSFISENGQRVSRGLAGVDKEFF